MGETSKHQIPFAEPNDPIDGHPAADKLQAEKIDDIVPPKGGQAGEALVKTANADYHYDWQPVGGGGGPTPDPDLGNLGDLISGESDNQLGLSDNGGTQDPPLLYVPPAPPVYDLLTGATEPDHFVGKSRPDVDAGVHSADELAQLAAAPVGSTYTCVEPSGSSNNVYNNGARVWMKSPPPQMYSSDPTDAVWQVVEGECILITSAKNGLLTAAVTRGFIQIVRKAQSIYTTVACDALAAENIASDLLTEPQFNGMLPSQASIGYLVSRRAPSGDYATAAHIGYVQVGRGGISLRQETGAELGWSSPPGSSPLDFALGGQAVGNTLGSAWPTADLVSYNDQGWNSDSFTVEELRELITEIENEGESHPQWDQYEQLKAELEQLYSQTQTGDL